MDDKNLNKIRNLLSFNITLNISFNNKLISINKLCINLNRHCDVGPLVKQSPDYILEKYNHWIGIEPITDYPNYTPDNLTPFFNQYHKIWKSDIYSIKRHLLYLKETENLNVLKMVNSFEKYFAPIEMISDEKKVGLHYINYKFSEEILRGNKENIKIFLRDMRLKELLK